MGLKDERNALDLDRIERLSRRRDVAAGLARAEIPDFASLLAHELLPLGVVHAAGLPGTVHTLLHPQLGNLAARAFFSGEEGVLPATADLETARIGSRNSLQRRFAARFGGRLPESERGRLVGQLCLHRPRECQTQLAAWIRDVPESETREIVLQDAARRVEGKDQSELRSFAAAALRGRRAGARPGDAGAGGAEHRPVRLLLHARDALSPRRRSRTLWRRCQAEPAQQDACREGRAAADLRLGALDAQLAETPDAAAHAP